MSSGPPSGRARAAIEDCAAFLELLYSKQPPSGFLSIWESRRKRSEHISVNTPLSWPSVASRIALIDANAATEDADLYFGFGLRSKDCGPSRRGAFEDVSVIPGFGFDLDIAGPGHAASNLPKSLEEGIDIITEIAPDPTALVHSGGGYYVWWLFHEPLLVDPNNRHPVQSALKSFHSRIVACAARRGLHLDNTGDLARVYRLPGSTNRKLPGQPRPVQLLDADGPRYTPSQLGVGASRPVRTVVFTDTEISDRPIPTLDQIRSSLRHCTKHSSRDLMTRVLAGQPLAEAGDRYRSIHRAISTMAFTCPWATPDQLFEILRPSLDAMGSIDGDWDMEGQIYPQFHEEIRKEILKGRQARIAREEEHRHFLTKWRARQMKGT